MRLKPSSVHITDPVTWVIAFGHYYSKTIGIDLLEQTSVPAVLV